MFDRRRRKWGEPAISQIAQERDFYPPETELQLTQVKISGNAALEKLRRRESLDPSDRMAATKYLATAHERVPKRRAQTEGLVPEALEMVLADWQRALDHHEKTGRDPTLISRRREQLADAAVKVRSNPLGGGVREFIQSPWPSDVALKSVYSMHWRVFHLSSNSEDFFIISDNPFSLIGPLGQRPSDAQFAFPISKTAVISGSWRPVRDGLRHLDADAHVLRSANHMQAAFSHRFVYSPRNESWIETLGNGSATSA
jgi:hypothetical protein